MIYPAPREPVAIFLRESLTCLLDLSPPRQVLTAKSVNLKYSVRGLKMSILCLFFIQRLWLDYSPQRVIRLGIVQLSDLRNPGKISEELLMSLEALGMVETKGFVGAV